MCKVCSAESVAASRPRHCRCSGAAGRGWRRGELSRIERADRVLARPERHRRCVRRAGGRQVAAAAHAQRSDRDSTLRLAGRGRGHRARRPPRAQTRGRRPAPVVLALVVGGRQAAGVLLGRRPAEARRRLEDRPAHGEPRLRPAAGGPERLAVSKREVRPHWSPDTRLVLYSAGVYRATAPKVIPGGTSFGRSTSTRKRERRLADVTGIQSVPDWQPVG